MKPPQAPGSILPPRVLPPSFECPKCNSSRELPVSFIDTYFENLPVVCAACGTQETAWNIALRLVKRNFMFTVFYPLGAKTTLFRTKIFLNTETRFDLYAEGLPENAVILDINYTPYA